MTLTGIPVTGNQELCVAPIETFVEWGEKIACLTWGIVCLAQADAIQLEGAARKSDCWLEQLSQLQLGGEKGAYASLDMRMDIMDREMTINTTTRGYRDIV